MLWKVIFHQCFHIFREVSGCRENTNICLWYIPPNLPHCEELMTHKWYYKMWTWRNSSHVLCVSAVSQSVFPPSSCRWHMWSKSTWWWPTSPTEKSSDQYAGRGLCPGWDPRSGKGLRVIWQLLCAAFLISPPLCNTAIWFLTAHLFNLYKCNKAGKCKVGARDVHLIKHCSHDSCCVNTMVTCFPLFYFSSL